MFFRSFRINHNLAAALLGALLVAVFGLAELMLPKEQAASAGLREETVSLPVAMYHHVLPVEARLNDYTISPEQLEQDLQYIQSCGYTTISAAELAAWAEGEGSLPPKPILLTFDDGYESVHEYAFPLLQKYGMKAVVSIIGKHTDLFSVSTDYKSVNWSHLTWDQCREMQQSGLVEIENHTYDMHDNISGKRYGIRIREGESLADYKQALLSDIGGLSDEIQQETGVRPIVFAYPFGALCRESKPILTEMGFRIILTCEEKVNALSPPEAGEPLVLRRFNRAHRFSTEEYYQKLGVTP